MSSWCEFRWVDKITLLIFFQSRVKCLLDTITHGFSWLFRPFWFCNAKGRNKKGNYWLAIGLSFRNALIQPVKWRYLICWFQADRFIPFHFLNVDEFWTFLLLRLSEVGQVNPKCKCPASIPNPPPLCITPIINSPLGCLHSTPPSPQLESQTAASNASTITKSKVEVSSPNNTPVVMNSCTLTKH